MKTKPVTQIYLDWCYDQIIQNKRIIVYCVFCLLIQQIMSVIFQRYLCNNSNYTSGIQWLLRTMCICLHNNMRYFMVF